MGMIDRLFGVFFGSGNVIRDTAEVFRENAEAAAVRGAKHREAALAQFEREFAHRGASTFDRVIDGLNRLPRPAMAFGTLGLLGSAMTSPEWFAARMQGLALVPEPLWWLLGAVVSFYFGARHQSKGQDFQREIVSALAAGRRSKPAPEDAHSMADGPEDNAALAEWRALHQRRV